MNLKSCTLCVCSLEEIRKQKLEVTYQVFFSEFTGIYKQAETKQALLEFTFHNYIGNFEIPQILGTNTPIYLGLDSGVGREATLLRPLSVYTLFLQVTADTEERSISAAARR